MAIAHDSHPVLGLDLPWHPIVHPRQTGSPGEFDAGEVRWKKYKGKALWFSFGKRGCPRSGNGNQNRLAASVCQVTRDQMELGPTGSDTGRSRFLLSSGCDKWYGADDS